MLSVAPIFESERALAEAHGSAQLLSRFLERGLDPEVVDLARLPLA